MAFRRDPSGPKYNPRMSRPAPMKTPTLGPGQSLRNVRVNRLSILRSQPVLTARSAINRLLNGR